MWWNTQYINRRGSYVWLFKLQVEFTVTIDKNHGCKKIFWIFHLFNPPPGVWRFEQDRFEMTTGRKWCSWLKWSKLDFYQISWHHTTPDSIQSHSDNLQAPPRHLPDTFQTHSRHPPILNNPRQLGEKEEANVYESDWVFINCLHFIPPRHYPESLTQPPDTSQTPSRHPSNTPKYSTFWPIQGN